MEFSHHLIIYTFAFPTVTRQNVFNEKGLLEFRFFGGIFRLY